MCDRSFQQRQHNLLHAHFNLRKLALDGPKSHSFKTMPDVPGVYAAAVLQVIAVICVLVWVMNINRFNDPALGGLVEGALQQKAR
jgi:hypothetical protein